METIKNDILIIQINEKGAELHSVKDRDGNEYLWQGDPKYWNGQAPNLFPYVGRLTNGTYQLKGRTYEMDIHGFAKDMIYEVVRISESRVMFRLKANEETKRQYPYGFSFCVTYSLADNKLAVLYQVENENNETMYFGLGGHPGFCVPLEEGLAFEDYYLEFAVPMQVKRIGFSEDCFVNGLDTSFPLEDGVKLPLKHSLFDEDAIVLVDMPKSVVLKSDCGNKFVQVEYPDMDYLGIWHMPKTDAPYVCIEPWACLPSRKDIVEDITVKPGMVALEAGGVYCNQFDIIFGV